MSSAEGARHQPGSAACAAVNTSSRSPRCRRPPSRPRCRCMRWPRTRRWTFSCAGRRPSSQTSRSPRPTLPWSRRSAGGWRGCRSPWSWPHRGSGCCPRQRCWPGWTHRLTFLTGGPGDLPARQRTMRETMAWSYDLLSSARAGTVPAAGRVPRRLHPVRDRRNCAAGTGDGSMDILDGIEALHRNSLLRLEETAHEEPTIPDAGDHPRVRAGTARGQRLRGRPATATRRLLPGVRRGGRPRHLQPRQQLAGWTGWRPTTTISVRRCAGAGSTTTPSGSASGGRALVVLVRPRACHRRPNAAGDIFSPCPTLPRSSAPRAEALLGAGQLALTQGDHTAAWTSLDHSIALFRRAG